MRVDLYVKPGVSKTITDWEYLKLGREISDAVTCSVGEPKNDESTPQNGRGYWRYRISDDFCIQMVRGMLAAQGLDIVHEQKLN